MAYYGNTENTILLCLVGCHGAEELIDEIYITK